WQPFWRKPIVLRERIAAAGRQVATKSYPVRSKGGPARWRVVGEIRDRWRGHGIDEAVGGSRLMELYQIRDFLALCETLNFARAAEKCHVSQPSLTRAIQKLERELGGQLIRRERRRTHLTELGELMRPMLQAMQAQAERIKACAERQLNQEGNTLRLGFLPSIGPLRLAPFFAQFSVGNPGIELQLGEAPFSSLCELLFRGELDAAVVAYVKRIDDRLRCHPLYKERLVCAIPRGHPL